MGSSGNKRLGLLAGAGQLPVMVGMAAAQQGYEVVAFGFEGKVAPGLRRVTKQIHLVPFCQLGELFSRMEKEGLRQAVTIGSIAQTSVLTGKERFDTLALELWSRLPDRRVDSIMRLLVEELSRRQIEMVSSLRFLEPHLAPVGVLTRRKPTESEWRDVRFGFGMAKAIGKLDVGQTVVVKHRAVMAVEAVEGTDRAIRRGGRLCQGGAVVVKVAKPEQDLRFDVPATGLHTISTMVKVGASVLALEAGIVLMVDREKMIARADQAGITILGVGQEIEDEA